MLSDMLGTGSFHNRSMTMGGSRATQTRTVQLNRDVTLAATPTTHMARTQTAAHAIFLYLSCMTEVYRYLQAKSVQECTVRAHHRFSLGTLRASVTYAAARAREHLPMSLPMSFGHCAVGNSVEPVVFATLCGRDQHTELAPHERQGVQMNENRGREERYHVPVATPAAACDGLLERQIDDERIARRAYEIYESRHRADGHADDDWFQAAAEYARRTIGPAPVEHAGASSSFGDRVRKARR